MNASSSDDAVSALIRQQMERRGIDRKALGHLLADGKNVTKAFRRLDEFLRSEAYRPEFIQRVAELLQIPSEQLAVAWESHCEMEENLRVEAARKQWEKTMARRGPHFWGILPENYYPSLITVLGAEFFLLVRLPEEFADLPQYEMTVEVGRVVRNHYQNHRRCRLAGYEFRPDLNNAYRFDTEGEYLGRVDGNLRDSRTFVFSGSRASGSSITRILSKRPDSP